MHNVECAKGHLILVKPGSELEERVTIWEEEGNVQPLIVSEAECYSCWMEDDEPDIEADFTDEEGVPDWWEQDEEHMIMLSLAGHHN